MGKRVTSTEGAQVPPRSAAFFTAMRSPRRMNMLWDRSSRSRLKFLMGQKRDACGMWV